MNRSTVSTIAVTTLLLGSGVSSLLFVKPALDEQAKLKTEKAGMESQKTSLQAQLAELEARVKRQAMGTISYFDLRTSLQQRRELETKTVETLASLTEILNDNKIDVQALEPKGETTGMNKPVPTGAPSGQPPGGPSAGPSAAPMVPGMAPSAEVSAAPSEAPVQLTHKVFRFLVRGEYPNLVRAMAEIQALPRAISINQFEVELVKDPNDPKNQNAVPDPTKPVISDSMLELDFQISISYLMAGGMPASATAPAAAPSAAPSGAAPVSVLPAGDADAGVPVSMQLLQWATSWLGEPAFAAEQRSRYEVVGLGADERDLVVRVRRGVPPFRMTAEGRRIVLELGATGVAPDAGMTGELPGVRSILTRPAAGRPGASQLVIETDGARFKPIIDAAGNLRLRRVDPAPAVATTPLAGRVPAQPRVLYAAKKPVVVAKRAPDLAARLVTPAAPAQAAADTARRGYLEQAGKVHNGGASPSGEGRRNAGEGPTPVRGPAARVAAPVEPAFDSAPAAAPRPAIAAVARAAGGAAPSGSGLGVASGEEVFDLAQAFGTTDVAEAPVPTRHVVPVPAPIAAPVATPAPAKSAAKGRAGKASKGEAANATGPAVRRDTASAETWDRLAQQAAREHGRGEADPFRSPLAQEPEDEAPAPRAVVAERPAPARAEAAPVVAAPERVAAIAPKPVEAAKPVEVAKPVAAVKPAEAPKPVPVAEPGGQRAMVRTVPAVAEPVLGGYKAMVGSAPAEAPIGGRKAMVGATPAVAPRPAAALPDLARRVLAGGAGGTPVRGPRLATAEAPATLRGVTYEHGALVVRTDGPAPTFRVLGGNKRSIVLELAETGLPGGGRQFDVGRDGVERVRAVLYDTRPLRVRLAVDTDGSVGVHPLVGPDGVLRLRLAPRGVRTHEQRLASAATSVIITTGKENPITRDPGSAHPRATRPTPPVLTTPTKKPRLVHAPRPAIARRTVRSPYYAHAPRPGQPVARPGATPTPMASPHPKTRATGAPIAAGGTPRPGASPMPTPTATPVFVPTPMPTQLPTPPGPSLGRSLTSSYAFPIDRDKLAGRKNPFKPIRKKTPSPAPGALGMPVVPGGTPVAVPGAPKVPNAKPLAPKPLKPKAATLSGGVYALGGIMTGGGQPPMALVTIDGKAYTVGLNESLPGNATVTAIRADHVILTADGRQVRLDIKR